MCTTFPLGKCSGLYIAATADTIVRHLIQWGDEPLVARHYHAEQVNESYSNALSRLNQRSFPPNRAVLLTLSPKWSIFFDNHIRDDIPQSESYVLARILQTETYSIQHCRPGDSLQGSVSHFNHSKYNTTSQQVDVRQVLLYYDDGWHFTQEGEPMPTENLQTYRNRRIPDRLTMQMLEAYAHALSIPSIEWESRDFEGYSLEWNNYIDRPRTFADRLLSWFHR